MTAVLERISQSLFNPQKAQEEGCPPDCLYEYTCDANNDYYSRHCCYRLDCTWACGDWVHIGTC